ncbi:MAG: hypothetical protein AB8G86_01635 [Saprospiraceae bacterium]
MRKLSLITYLLIGAIGCLWANNTTPASIITYSVEASPFSTDFGNNFAYYHVNLDLGDLTRVAKNGKLRVVVDFQRGMEIAETRFEQKPNGTIYYVTDLTTPIYNARVTDLSGNTLLEKTYGGEDRIVDYGRTLNYTESELAEKWLNEKDQFLQRIEFQNLDFVDFEIDLIELLENNPIVSPVDNNAAKRTTSTVITTLESAASTEVAAEQIEAAEPINEAAAAKEEEVMNDPFGELKEPLENDGAKENGEIAPATPVDYEESAQAEKEKEQMTTKKTTATPEGLTTPVISDKRNIVKLNLPNLAFGNITLNYERILSARNSVALNVGFIRPQQPIGIINDAFNTDETISTPEFSGITATGEYRFYSSRKGAGRGFYFAPYARYANHKLDFNATIEDNFSNVATQLSAIGLGGQIGVQWLIKDRIAIDWGILGLAAQWYNLKATYSSPLGEDINFDEIRADLEAEIEESPLTNKLEFSNTDDSLEAKMPFLFGGARTYLSVGYKF